MATNEMGCWKWAVADNGERRCEGYRAYGHSEMLWTILDQRVVAARWSTVSCQHTRTSRLSGALGQQVKVVSLLIMSDQNNELVRWLTRCGRKKKDSALLLKLNQRAGTELLLIVLGQEAETTEWSTVHCACIGPDPMDPWHVGSLSKV